jgi:hypothetical protein
MAELTLRLFEDELPAGGDPVFFPAIARACYVAAGDLLIEDPSGAARHEPGSAWLGEDAIAWLPGAAGARVLRWELVAATLAHSGLLHAAPRAGSVLKLAADLELDAGFGWLLRCDEVAFPKGGVAYTHVHQGPGIRVCLEGRMRMETGGEASEYGPGEAWFESGAAPVLAPTSESEPTRFVRCFVLPRACKGRSSIRYVLPEDTAKPKPQRYKLLGERFIDLG